MKPASLFLALLAAACPARAEVKLSPLFGDHMVLQQGIKAPVFGTANPGEKVTVSIAGKQASATAGPDGKWKATLDPLPVTREGVDLTVAGTNRLVFHDVLVGEVWVCSGQSNMEFGVGKASNASQAIHSATNPQIRLFLVTKTIGFKPAEAPVGHWAVCSEQEIARSGWSGFSAVGYFFGKEIQEARKVPVGLIGTYWGGTPAESWTSVEALRANPALERYAARFEKVSGSLPEAKAAYDKELAAFPALHDAWQAEFGAENDAALVKWKEESAQAAAAGKPAPIKPTPPKPEPVKPRYAGDDSHVPSVLYNAMIAPLIPYGIKGAIWYQGEANAGTAETANDYAILFPTMIGDWRQRWGLGDFPFLFVQLAGWGWGKAWPELRDAQRKTLSLPNTGMAVALDVGAEKDIHPADKLDVGHRLALAGRKVAYGENVVASGPVFDQLKKDGARLRVTYQSVGGGLVIGANPTGLPDAPPPPPLDHLEGFEVAGADGRFVPAKARIDGSAVVVEADGVTAPAAVRYGWKAYPTVNLYNKEGLPAVPFLAK